MAVSMCIWRLICIYLCNIIINMAVIAWNLDIWAKCMQLPATNLAIVLIQNAFVVALSHSLCASFFPSYYDFKRNIILCTRHAVTNFSDIIHDFALATAARAVSLDNTLCAHIKIKIIFNFFPLLWLCLVFSFFLFFLSSACRAVDEARFCLFARRFFFMHSIDSLVSQIFRHPFFLACFDAHSFADFSPFFYTVFVFAVHFGALCLRECTIFSCNNHE